jgi:rare lipoprotein A
MELPFGSMVRVTNLANGKSVVVKVNDRGAFKNGRIIDLSKSAFSTIGNIRDGIIKVKVEVL